VTSRVRKFGFLLLFVLTPLTLFSAVFDDDIKMGPILHFNGEDAESHTWKLSALYLIKSDFEKSQPKLVFHDQARQEIALVDILSGMNAGRFLVLGSECYFG